MKYYCNPINVPYRYQFHAAYDSNKAAACREAADPSMVLYKGKYYLFASMSLEVWVSCDMAHWECCRLPDDLPLYDYAPDVRVIGEYMYFSASKRGEICDFYRTKDPIHGPYEKIAGSFDFWDPNLFLDDDGRFYFYWGCDNVTPVWGVELDKVTMRPIGERQVLVTPDISRKGFERYEDGSENAPYIEGAWMTKRNGKYYLQIACPGAEYRIYADAVYESSKPLGPFTLAKNNPYSYHPGGFMGGAGHGSTLEDKYDNFFHAATMSISMNHKFERRVGIWPAGFDADGELFCNQRFGDWPRAVEDGALDPWEEPAWFLLSYAKSADASSYMPGRPASNATDENAHTWWRAKTNNSGEWLRVDLGAAMEVHAVQINFADEEIAWPSRASKAKMTLGRYIDDVRGKTRWLLEGSTDGENYFTIADKSNVDTDLPHDLVIDEEGKVSRYIRLTVFEVPYNENPCVSALRVFGKADAALPQKCYYNAGRISPTQFRVTVGCDEPDKKANDASNDDEATGYELLWGHSPDKLYHSCTVYKNNALPYTTETIGALVSDEEYFVRVDSFNEAGITHGEVKKLEDTIPCIRQLSGIDTLFVAELPFFARGGELHNSSASSQAYVEECVRRGIEGLNLNTLLVPVYWEQVEPEMGQYCFDMIDAVIDIARKKGLHIGILWFGLWKNAESTYAPAYIKEDTSKYFCAKDVNGKCLGAVSPFCNAAIKRDAKAFTALMAHLKEVDRYKTTVIFVQVENEVGLLGTDRDYCDAANDAFKPYTEHGALCEAFMAKYFGLSVHDFSCEAFMAKYFAMALEEIAKAGRAVYPIPCYTNAWLKQFPWYPGSYPSGGPVAAMHSVWKKKAPSLFALAPDIYVQYAADVMDEYHHAGNPLMIPETRKDAYAASYALYAFLGHDAICFSPFGIEDLGLGKENMPSDEVLKILNIAPSMYSIAGGKEALSAVNKVLSAAEPLYLKCRGSGHLRAFIKRRESDRGELLAFEHYSALVTFMDDAPGKPLSSGAVFCLNDNSFLVIGMRCLVKFLPRDTNKEAKALKACEMDYSNGKFTEGRRLNGDEQMPFICDERPRVIAVTLYTV